MSAFADGSSAKGAPLRLSSLFSFHFSLFSFPSRLFRSEKCDYSLFIIHYLFILPHFYAFCKSLFKNMSYHRSDGVRHTDKAVVIRVNAVNRRFVLMWRYVKGSAVDEIDVFISLLARL